MNRSGPTRRFQPASGAAKWRPTTRAVPGPAAWNNFGASVARWSAWAKGIADRRTPGQHHWDWLSRVLVHPAIIRRTARPSVTWTVALTMHPRSTVTNRIFVAAPNPPASPPVRQQSAQPPTFVEQIRPQLIRTIDRARQVPADHTAVTHRHQRTVRTAEQASTLVTRLTARRERREAAEPTVTMPATQSFPAPATVAATAGHVVVQRRPPAQPEPPTPLRRSAPSAHDVGDAMRMSPPPIDLQSLADQVIRTIDQRVIAARERLGGQ